MTRGEQLQWWRSGYTAGYHAAAREYARRGADEHERAVAEFREQRRADEQARADALLLEVVDVLATAMLGKSVVPARASRQRPRGRTSSAEGGSRDQDRAQAA